MSVHKIEIKNVNGPDQISCGHNTEIFLDGKRLEGVTEISYSVKFGEPARVTIEMCAEVKIEALADLNIDQSYDNIGIISKNENTAEIFNGAGEKIGVISLD